MRGAQRRRAFTLLEAILALSLTIMLMSGVYGFYVTMMKARYAAVDSMKDVLLMRALLEQMAEEIRHSTDIVPGDNVGLRGDKHSLTIVRLALPDIYAFGDYDPTVASSLPPGQEDLLRVTYQLLWDDELEDPDGTKTCHGLFRTFQRTFDPNPSFQISAESVDGVEKNSGLDLGIEQDLQVPKPEGELFAPEVKYLKFEYYDGAVWRDRWQTSPEVSTDEQGLGASGTDEEMMGGESSGTGTESGTGADLSGLAANGTGTGSDAGVRRAGARNADRGGATGDMGATGGLTGNLNLGSGSSTGGQKDQDGYILPQAIRITIGRVKVPIEDEENLNLSPQEEEERKTYHPDRYTVVIYLREADQTLLSSRKYGVQTDQQMGEQTEGY